MDKFSNILENVRSYFYVKEPVFKKPDAYKNVNASQTK